MPVTAKLSRRFYETFGDEIANELVEWFNQVDATYRADLRELNEANFATYRPSAPTSFASSARTRATSRLSTPGRAAPAAVAAAKLR